MKVLVKSTWESGQQMWLTEIPKKNKCAYIYAITCYIFYLPVIV